MSQSCCPVPSHISFFSSPFHWGGCCTLSLPPCMLACTVTSCSLSSLNFPTLCHCLCSSLAPLHLCNMPKAACRPERLSKWQHNLLKDPARLGKCLIAMQYNNSSNNNNNIWCLTVISFGTNWGEVRPGRERIGIRAAEYLSYLLARKASDWMVLLGCLI